MLFFPEKLISKALLGCFFFLFLTVQSTISAQTAIPYRQADKWGLANEEADIVLPCIYDEIEESKSRVRWVRIGSRFGYVSTDGKTLSRVKFKAPSQKLKKRFGKKLRRLNGEKRKTKEKKVQIGTCGGAISIENDIFIEKNNTTGRFHQIRCLPLARYGSIDTLLFRKPLSVDSIMHPLFDGCYLSKMDFDEYSYIQVNRVIKAAFIRKDSLWGILDVGGKMRTGFDFSAIKYGRDRTYPPFLMKKDKQWQFIDENGKSICPYHFLKAEPFNEEYQRFTKVWTSDTNWGYLRRDGVPFFED